MLGDVLCAGIHTRQRLHKWGAVDDKGYVGGSAGEPICSAYYGTWKRGLLLCCKQHVKQQAAREDLDNHTWARKAGILMEWRDLEVIDIIYLLLEHYSLTVHQSYRIYSSNVFTSDFYSHTSCTLYFEHDTDCCYCSSCIIYMPSGSVADC